MQYADVGRNEIVDYTYDDEGQMTSKESSRADHGKDGWIRETDYYKYDELGRLVSVRRRNPEDIDTRFPDENKELLAIDYDYDRVGNVRHTKVGAHYKANATRISEDYFLYDENNRMTINKGVLVNGTIQINSTQGSSLSYDEAGNLTGAKTYEHGYEQNYQYGYTDDNQLREIRKNTFLVQTKTYDEAGRIKEERSFNDAGNLAQRNIMTYIDGELSAQSTLNGMGIEVSHGSYKYDAAGNVTSWTVSSGGLTQTHEYTYEYWDTYQQKTDDVTMHIDGRSNTYGKSVRTYDVNGLLESSEDKNKDPNIPSHTTTYLNSSLDGIRARNDKNGRTGYLTVAGKTIGELVLDKSNTQKLTVYGGFTPAGSQQKASAWQHLFQMNQSFNRAPGDKADGTLPEAPQDNLGTYTLQVGDTMERIALQVYGDSSLWYLIADANGISDRKATAGYDDSLHVGQRLNLPAAATGQHQTNATHKVLNANQMIGETSATTALPAPKPPKPKHHSIWSKVLIAAVAVVATVLTAGVMTAGMAGLSSMFSAGLTALSGGVAGTAMGTTLAVGFTAGFVGSIASQGVANALGMQKGLDMTGALISGLATAATAGVGNALKGFDALKNITSQLNKHSFTNFNLATSAEMMELNAAGQVVNVALRKHQHFDWLSLGVSGATGGFLGCTAGRKFSDRLNQIDQSGIVRSELQALVGAGAESAVTGSHFDAAQVLTDSLGNAVGNALVSGISSPDYMAELQQTMDELSIDGLLADYQTAKEDFNNFRARLAAEEGYHQVQTYGGYNNEYSPIPKSGLHEFIAISHNSTSVGSNKMMSIGVRGDTLTQEISALKESPAPSSETNFDLLQIKIFGHEGGISNHPNDYGGYTNKGITFGTFKEFSKKDLGIEPTLHNLKNLTKEQAAIIYKKRFWEVIQADKIDSFSVAYTLFDFHVNAPGHAVEVMQQSINALGGKLLVDNKMGPKTIKAINGLDAHQLFDTYQKKRINYYINRVNKHPDQKVFLPGWLNRVDDIKFER